MTARWCFGPGLAGTGRWCRRRRIRAIADNVAKFSGGPSLSTGMPRLRSWAVMPAIAFSRKFATAELIVVSGDDAAPPSPVGGDSLNAIHAKLSTMPSRNIHLNEGILATGVRGQRSVVRCS